MLSSVLGCVLLRSEHLGLCGIPRRFEVDGVRVYLNISQNGLHARYQHLVFVFGGSLDPEAFNSVEVLFLGDTASYDALRPLTRG